MNARRELAAWGRDAVRMTAVAVWFAVAAAAYRWQMLASLLAFSMGAWSAVDGFARRRAGVSGPYRYDFVRELRAGRVRARDWAPVALRSACWVVFAWFVGLTMVPAHMGPALVRLQQVALWGLALHLVFVSELRPPRAARSLGVTVAMVVAAAALVFEGGRFLFGDRGPGVELAAPWEGAWVVSQGGVGLTFSHHYRLPSQRHALDLSPVENGRVSRGGRELSDYSCWDRALLAPAAGTVARVVDGLPDWPIGQRDREQPVGNHVVVQLGPERYVLFAHLKQGSVAVAEGDRVQTGQLLGRCGNSGNTTQPHLHLQAQTHADPLEPGLRTLPMRIRSAGGPLPARAPRRNDEIVGVSVASPPPSS